MNWISNVVPPKIRSLLRRETPENLWVKCPESGQLVFHKDLEANLMVVPGSGYHMAIEPRARLASLFDDGVYEMLPVPETVSDPLKFRDVFVGHARLAVEENGEGAADYDQRDQQNKELIFYSGNFVVVFRDHRKRITCRPGRGCEGSE